MAEGACLRPLWSTIDMPRATAPLKRDLLKAELARLLGLPVADVFTREEAGAFLGRHPKTFSNDDGAAPFFYKADLGRNGLALYTLSDLKLWRDDKAAFGKLRMAAKTNERPWPSLPTGALAPPAPAKPDREVFLDSLTDNEDYKAKVLGRRPWV